jgi:hypothetical protein
VTQVLSGARVLIHQGTTYRARARVDAPSFLVTKSAIASALEDEGFAPVSVFKDISELPADWPQDQRLALGGFASFTAFIEATWPKPDEARPIPEQVIAAWVHKRPPGEEVPAMSSAPIGTHVWARELLRLAWRASFGETPNEPTMQAVQAIALHESSYGFALKTPDGTPSNNWGAVQCGSGWHAVDCLTPQECPAGCFVHRDTNAKGVCYLACFRQYAEPFLGAKDFVRTLAGVASRARVKAALGYGNATVIAREMRSSGYFEASVKSYAAGIGTRAKQIASALGEPVYVEPTNVLAGLFGFGLVAGAGVLWYRKEGTL